MYLLDANVFIQAKNLHYGFDFVPAFWDWLIRESEAGTVASIEKVADELRSGGDDLSDWAEARGERFFLAPDALVIPALRQVSDWASGQDYDPAAISTFLKVADYWLSPMRWHTATSSFRMRSLPTRAGRLRYRTRALVSASAASTRIRCCARKAQGSSWLVLITHSDEA